MRAPEFWNGESSGARAVGAALSPLGALYGLSVRLKQKTARPFRPHARVICVGNLTVGGTGKTPVAMAIARALKDKGRRVAFLSRGFGGSNSGPLNVEAEKHSSREVGDEPLLLAAVAPTIVARNRAQGAALADQLGAEIIIMDDGFQNFSIEKDLSLLVIDADQGFGNGRLVPAGPLRESPAQGFARADAAVMIGGGMYPFKHYAGPILHAHIVAADDAKFADQKVLAFSGIGRPEKFFHTVKKMGATLVETRGFPDHHNFTTGDMAELKARAMALGAQLVTTEKDFVRLDASARSGVAAVPIRIVFEDLVALAALLGKLAP